MGDGLTVGVVIPVLNREEVVAEAIGSVMSQTLAVDRLVVVDDGSTDGTGEVARRLAQRHDIMSLITQENAGPSAARNRALADLETDLVTFLDSDDLMVPDRVEFQVEFLRENPEAGGVMGTSEIQIMPGVEAPASISIEISNAATNHYPHSAMLRTADVRSVGGYDEELRIGEDVDLLVRLKSAGSRMSLVERTLVVRRVFGDNLSYQNDRSQSFLLSGMRRHLRDGVSDE